MILGNCMRGLHEMALVVVFQKRYRNLLYNKHQEDVRKIIPLRSRRASHKIILVRQYISRRQRMSMDFLFKPSDSEDAGPRFVVAVITAG